MTRNVSPVPTLAGLLLAMTLVLLTGACTDTPQAAPGGASGSPSATDEEPGLRLVVLGDSIPSPTACSGCVTFPDQVATELGTTLGTRVELLNLSWEITNPKPAEVADVVEYLRSDQAARAAVAGADAILINSSQNDLAYNRRDDPCGVAPDYPSVRWEDLTHACIDQTLDEYRRDLDALLDEVDALRAQRPTMLRIVTGYNSAIGDLVDPTWNSAAAVEPTTYNVSRMVDLQCDLATQHGGKCADTYHALNGPDGQQDGQPYLDDYDATHLNQGGHDQIAATMSPSDSNHCSPANSARSTAGAATGW